MDLESKHHHLCSSALRFQGLKKYLVHEDLSPGVQGCFFLGHRVINPIQQGNCRGGTEPAKQDIWLKVPSAPAGFLPGTWEFAAPEPLLKGAYSLIMALSLRAIHSLWQSDISKISI